MAVFDDLCEVTRQSTMTQIASLMTINATAGLIAAFIAGPITDRVGRKWVMVFSLVGNGLVYFFKSGAHTYLSFALLMILSGSFNPLYWVGADAMLADLIPSEKRAGANNSINSVKLPNYLIS